MKPVYMHGGNAYIVVEQKPIEHFTKTFGDQPQHGSTFKCI
jgi:hypothetical protein